MLIGIFLFLKQIVDVIYELKVLDVLMVVFALALIGVQSFRLIKNSKEKVSVSNAVSLIKHEVKPIDYVVLVLGVLYALSFLRDTAAVASMVKIESVFLIYFLGRIYGKEIQERGRALAISGYLIVYSNMIYIAVERWCIKFKGFDYSFNEHGILNGGGLYYYKTDLAIGLIIASLFIYLYSKSNIFKWITIYIVVPFTIYDAKARMGKAILAGVLMVILIRELILFLNKKISSKRVQASKLVDADLSKRKIGFIEIIFGLVTICIACLFVAIQVTPIKQHDYYSLGLSEELMIRLENLCHSRHIIWWDTFHNMANQGFITRCIGIDLHNFPEYNSPHYMSHCLYLNMFFAIGYIGIFAFVAFLYLAFKTISQVASKDVRFVASSLLLVFLIFGISMDPIEYTQISWFPFMYVGVAVSMLSSYKKEESN